MKFFLVLLFACAKHCGEPDHTVITDTHGQPVAYASRAECVAAGEKWLAPAANPQGAVKAFNCTPHP